MCFTLTETKIKQAETWKTHRLQMAAAAESKETSQEENAASLADRKKERKKPRSLTKDCCQVSEYLSVFFSPGLISSRYYYLR